MKTAYFKPISLGHQQLDEQLGGISIASIILLEENLIGIHTDTFIKLYIAQGLLDKHNVLISSADLNSSHICDNIPNTQNSDKDKYSNNSTEKLDIAWRYKNLKPHSDHIKNEAPHIPIGKFDLTSTIEEKQFLTLDNIYFHNALSKELCHSGKVLIINRSSIYENILEAIELCINSSTATLEASILSNSLKSRVLRIVIRGLGSPYYLGKNLKGSSPEKFCLNLCKFLICLKSLIVKYNATLLISMPIQQFKDKPHLLAKIETVCDSVICLKSFASLYTPLSPLFTNYDGAFQIKKVCNMYNLPYKTGQNDLAYKLKKRTMLIESLHLPPDFLSNTTPKLTSMCSDASTLSTLEHKSSAIDF